MQPVNQPSPREHSGAVRAGEGTRHATSRDRARARSVAVSPPRTLNRSHTGESSRHWRRTGHDAHTAFASRTGRQPVDSSGKKIAGSTVVHAASSIHRLDVVSWPRWLVQSWQYPERFPLVWTWRRMPQRGHAVSGLPLKGFSCIGGLL